MCDFCVNVYVFVRNLLVRQLVCENIHMQISHVSRCLDTNKINEKHCVLAIEKAYFVVLLMYKTN